MTVYDVSPTRVYHGDCLAVMREMEPTSVDAVVTDPPAGIAFMGRKWDTFTRDQFLRFLTERLAECLRLLKPGGHALVWALPRTSHWTGAALEEAGFEVRDVITHHFGSGFPKSLDVSKAIDKAAGAERPVVGLHPAPNGQAGGVTMGGGWQDEPALTDPATAAARQWDGWGTALKPATEFWYLGRKPLAEHTVAGQVLATGTGALNVDGCRVAANGDKLDGGRVSSKSDGWDRPWKHDPEAIAEAHARGQGAVARAESLGRWPANLVLSHSADCRPVGTEPDGLETVEAWWCAEDCPVAELDRQSGTLTSGDNPTRRGSDKFRGIYGAFQGQRDNEPARGANSGGASRFYTTFRYVPKAGTAERNVGLFDSSQGRNLHPTVKPVDLMRWLCRLITPAGGLVLDPFAGSGSTLVAAKLEGFQSIGIEADPEHVKTIIRRLAVATHQPPLFDPEAA